MQIEKNKAPGPYGFPAEFYQKIWGMLKDDLMFKKSILKNFLCFILILGQSFFFQRNRIQSKFNCIDPYVLLM
jgi:hypothetical protein